MTGPNLYRDMFPLDPFIEQPFGTYSCPWQEPRGENLCSNATGVVHQGRDVPKHFGPDFSIQEAL